MFLFYSESAGSYWMMPSLDFVREATVNKAGQNAGLYSVVFTVNHADGRAYPRPRFEAWRDNWLVLTTIAEDLAARPLSLDEVEANPEAIG